MAQARQFTKEEKIMAIPKGQNKKSLINKSKDKVVKVASGGQGIKELTDLFAKSMFVMGEGWNSPEGSSAEQGMYHTGRSDALKYGKLLRQKGVMVKLPR